MGKIPKPPKIWLDRTVVKDGDIIQLLSEPHLPKSENPFRNTNKINYSKNRLNFECVRNQRTGEFYKWSVNCTTWRRLFNAYGEDGKNWLGKLVKIKVVPTIINGRTCYPLYGTPYGETKEPTLDITEKEKLEC